MIPLQPIKRQPHFCLGKCGTVLETTMKYCDACKERKATLKEIQRAEAAQERVGENDRYTKMILGYLKESTYDGKDQE